MPSLPSIRLSAALLVAAALVLGSLGAGVGRAAVIEPYPGISYPDGAYNSRCAPISLGPQVVEVGQKIIEHAGPATDECDSLPKDITWAWSVGGSPVSGCKATDRSCVVREDTPSDLGAGGEPTGGFFKTITDSGKEAVAKKVLEKGLEYAGKTFAVEVPGGLLIASGDVVQAIKPTAEPLTTPLGQDEAVTGLFAAPFGLHTDGLGAVLALALDPEFVKAIAGDGSLMRRFAAFVKDEREHKGGGFNYRIHLVVDEVSYCQDGLACGPGDDTPGVQPFLDLRFEATSPSSSNKNETHFEAPVVVPYFAALFDIAQFGGKPPPLLH